MYSDIQEKTGSILISAAVYEEIEPLVNFLGRFEKSRAGGKDVFFFPYINGKTVRIIVSGAGAVNSAQALTAAIESYRPDVVIQTGCAGVFMNSGLEIGDVALASSERDIHLGIESEDAEMPPENLPFDIPGIGEDGEINLAGSLQDKCFSIISENTDFRAGSGAFITVSTVTSTDDRAAMLERWYNPLMESMEGAASAQISALYNIPFIEIRSGSNFVGKRDRNLWNLPLAFRNSSLAVLKIIKSI